MKICIFKPADCEYGWLIDADRLHKSKSERYVAAGVKMTVAVNGARFKAIFRPELVVATDGQWLLLPAPADNSGAQAAILRLVNQVWSFDVEAILDEEGEAGKRLSIQKIDDLNRIKFETATRWDGWNDRGLTYGQRMQDLAKNLPLRFRNQILRMPESSFKTLCCRDMGLAKVKPQNDSKR